MLIMKYYPLGSSNNNCAETKTSGFTSYADIGISENKMSFGEKDTKRVREELESVQKALKLQTSRCRQLVAEYTRKLQEKERLYRSEKALRDTQLAKVLKALLIFEARLKQEQKFISHQLNEKDFIISTQRNDIRKLLANAYCKNCNQYLESLDSGSEYVTTEFDYQSSNLESLDSSSDTYGASETSSKKSDSKTGDYLENRHKKSYFQVLKLRNESPLSNDDNTSADYDNLDSLPPESVSDKISVVSGHIENMLNQSASLRSDSSTNISSECDKTVINTLVTKLEQNNEENNKLTETLPVFEASGDTNDNWYASASDPEDDDQRDVYRNNPVLECMNQILLQNINDINSPPKTPNIERKGKNNKRVKFSDEENDKQQNDYYETPVQKTANFYETPQSIYSNDYEQILSKSSESSSDGKKEPKDHHYIEMEKENASKQNLDNNNRKSKILRLPPALPPKPANLLAKCKIQQLPKKPPSEVSDLEPDYCSISELNLPPNKISARKTINVVAEVHKPNVDLKNDNEKPEEIPGLVVKKCVEKLNIQLAKQTAVKQENPKTVSPNNKKKIDVQIPKLPQVSEIIIPDDPEENDKLIAQDNYIKNNTQILQGKSPRKPILIGSSVSTLISGFNNNNQMIEEIKKRHERIKPERKKPFSSFENLQNSDKQQQQQNNNLNNNSNNDKNGTRFENSFDLSQNFEEFKLDDCEIEEYDVEEELKLEETKQNKLAESKFDFKKRQNYEAKQQTGHQTSINILKKQLELQKHSQNPAEVILKKKFKFANQPNYEHFLECTGLSSKSILTPSRTLSNHKNMLKPKDVKLRSKVKSNNNIFFERPDGGGIKYWSEPFV